jgi:hypothetical protein
MTVKTGGKDRNVPDFADEIESVKEEMIPGWSTFYPSDCLGRPVIA